MSEVISYEVLPLEVLTWISLYKYKSKDDQVQILKQIMKQSDIFNIDLADDNDHKIKLYKCPNHLEFTQIDVYKCLKYHYNIEPSIEIIKKCKKLFNMITECNNIYSNIFDDKLPEMITVSKHVIPGMYNLYLIYPPVISLFFKYNPKLISIRLSNNSSVSLNTVIENDEYYNMVLKDWTNV